MEQLVKDIEHMRLCLGLSKRDLAISAEISEEYYWKIVTGRAPGVAYTILTHLAAQVGIKVLHYIQPDTLQKPDEKSKLLKIK